MDITLVSLISDLEDTLSENLDIDFNVDGATS